MADGLDVIIVDDDPSVCKILSRIITGFYAWGEVLSFTDVDEAISQCLHRDIGIPVFVIDVFLGEKSGFYFLDTIEEVLTSFKAGRLKQVINHLLEKPVKAYALQFGIRAVAEKYLKFARKLMKNSEFADTVAGL